MSAIQPTSPLSADLLPALGAGTLVLDCPEVVLTRDENGVPAAIEGAGSISLAQSQFELKMFCRELGDPFENFRKLETWVPGTVISRNELYKLRATDSNGFIWESENLLIKRSGTGMNVISASVTHLRNLAAISRADTSVTLIFFDDFELPCNQNVRTETKIGPEEDYRSYELTAVTIETPDHHIEVRPGLPGHKHVSLTVEFLGPQELPSGFEYRVTEALRYTTFRPVWWSAIKRQAPVREVTIDRAITR
jgi:hypothetical protein